MISAMINVSFVFKEDKIWLNLSNDWCKSVSDIDEAIDLALFYCKSPEYSVYIDETLAEHLKSRFAKFKTEYTPEVIIKKLVSWQISKRELDKFNPMLYRLNKTENE